MAYQMLLAQHALPEKQARAWAAHPAFKILYRLGTLTFSCAEITRMRHYQDFTAQLSVIVIAAIGVSDLRLVVILLDVVAPQQGQMLGNIFAVSF